MLCVDLVKQAKLNRDLAEAKEISQMKQHPMQRKESNQ
jgi:hypothetical protein